MQTEFRRWSRPFRERALQTAGDAPTYMMFDFYRHGLAALILGGLLALLSPFGTNSYPVGLRLLYWITLIAVGIAIGRTVMLRAVRWRFLARRPWLWGPLAVPAIALPMTLVTWLATRQAFQSHTRPVDILDLVGPVFLITALITTVIVVMERGRSAQLIATEPARPLPQILAEAGPVNAGPVAGGPTVAEVAPAPLSERLPAQLLGARILAVQAQDHYIRVYTSRGPSMVLMRFADALGEVEQLDGLQVHRSWWVARTAVELVSRSNGRATLKLGDATLVPVSRAYARILRDKGWL